MKLNTGRNRILLHLEKQNNKLEIHNKEEQPYAVCQKGISEAVNLSRGRTSSLIKDMIDDDLIKENISRVTGLKRRRKIYSLTSKGLKKAKNLRKNLEKKKVVIKRESSTLEVKLIDIDSHFEGENPLLKALNRIKKDNLIDLNEKQVREKESFVGRKEEIEFLSESIERFREKDNSKLILVKGDAGIGKTRLIKEFKDDVLSSNTEFLEGKGYYNSSEPYLAFKDAFEPYKDNKGALLEFSRDKNKEDPDDYGEKSEYQRDLLFSETAENIRNLAHKKNIIIFIDDLQWVDRASLMLLHYLTDKLKGDSVIFIGAYRPEDVSNDTFLDEVLKRMSRQKIIKEIELEPLNWENTKAMIKGILRRDDIPDDFVKLIHDISEGNPLFSKELVKHMLDNGDVKPKKELYPRKREDIIVPKVVDNIIERRIKKFDHETLKVLQIGSIVGEQVPFDLLSFVSDMSDFELVDHIGILKNAGIWETELEDNSYYFSHGLIKSSVYDDISKPIRRKIHGKVADFMESEYGENKGNKYSDIAYHLKKSGDFSKSYQYYIKAGKRAKRMYANEDALNFFEEALALRNKLDKKETKRWVIMEEMGDIHRILGEYENSINCYDDIPIEKIDPRSQQRIYRKLARVYESLGEYKKTSDILEKGLNTKYGRNIETCRLLYRKGLSEMRKGNYNSAEENFSEALELCRELGKDRERAEINQGLGTVYLYKSDYQRAKNHLKKALNDWEKIEDLEGKSFSLNALGNVHTKLGNLDTGLDHYEESLDLRKKIGDKRDISSTLNNIGIIYLKKGDLERSFEYSKKGHDIWKDIEDQRGVAASLINIAEYYLRKGELDTALKKNEESLDISEKINFKRGIATSLSNIGTIYLMQEKIEKAEKRFQRSLDICEKIGYKHLKNHLLNSLAMVFIKQGKLDKALEKTDSALNLSDEIKENIERGISYKIKGIIHKNKNEFEDGQKEFDKGLKILKKTDEKKEVAELLYHYADIWKKDGDEKKFRDYMENALSLFEEIGMEYWISKVKEELS